MVNARVVSLFAGGTPPPGAGASRKIAGGPLYERAAVLTVLAQGESAIVPWTRKCISDLKNYELDHQDVMRLIGLALDRGRFKGSEWCINKPGGVWAACDSYQVVEKRWVPAAHKDMDFEYYLKFAIGRTGQVILTVSCHPPEERW